MRTCPSLSLALVFYYSISSSSALAQQSCNTGKVDERVAVFLKERAPDLTLAQLNTTSIESLRKDEPKIFKRLPNDSVKRITVEENKIKVNVVRVSAKNGLPVIVNFHEGGFIKPLLPSMEYEALYLAKRLNAVVFDVDYRVAPEHKFPTAVNDAYTVYHWVTQHANEYGGDGSKVILNGIGAGASLAALVAHKAKKEGTIQPIKLVVMLCPSTDNPMISYYSSFDENANGYGLTRDRALFNFQIFTEKTEWFKNDPALCPIYEKDFSTMPAHLIMVTEFDVFRDEGIAYGKKLEKAGNDVIIKCFPHQIHEMAGLPKNSGEVNRVYELMGEAIAKIDAPKDNAKK